MIRLLVIEDHALVRDALVRLLQAETDLTVVGWADDGEEGFRLWWKLRPDLTLLDLKIKRENGLALLRRIMATDRSARVLVLTMFDDPLTVSQALRLGAAGYITKHAPFSLLLKAVRCVAAGERFVEAELARKLVRDATEAPSPLAQLTAREFEVFLHLVRGMPVREIAQVLHMSPKTVWVHRGNLMRKLQANNVADLVRIAYRHGLLGADDPPATMNS